MSLKIKSKQLQRKSDNHSSIKKPLTQPAETFWGGAAFRAGRPSRKAARKKRRPPPAAASVRQGSAPHPAAANPPPVPLVPRSAAGRQTPASRSAMHPRFPQAEPLCRKRGRSCLQTLFRTVYISFNSPPKNFFAGKTKRRASERKHALHSYLRSLAQNFSILTERNGK